MKGPSLRFVKFCLVGASGVVVNAGLLRLLARYLGLDYRLASLIAIEFAIANNFVWNAVWTFRDRSRVPRTDLARMFLKFNLTSGLTAMVVNWGLLVLLAERAGMRVETANLVGIAAGTTTNFLLSRGWIFRPPVSR
jgi:dolichol-phosphate mannosyltransferase